MRASQKLSFKIVVLSLLMAAALPAKAQKSQFVGHRLHFGFGPSVSIGNRFYGTEQTISAPFITGSHHIAPFFSPLWGYPNPDYTFMQNLGRKLHFTLEYERFLKKGGSITTGAELGARGYEILSDFSQNVRMTYRVLSFPLYYSKGLFTGRYWQLRALGGVQVNRAQSLPRRTERYLEIANHHIWYPTLMTGFELRQRQLDMPFTFLVSYHHGFYNILQHNYLALDYETPIPITSNGSHFKLGVRLLLFEKVKEIKPIDLYKPDAYDLLMYRKLKEPLNIQTKDTVLRICLLDDQTIDGDSVVVEFNQRLVYKDVPLQREGFCFTLHLDLSKDNVLIIHALNEGKIPPNTCIVLIGEGETAQRINLKSDLTQSAVIRFSYNP